MTITDELKKLYSKWTGKTPTGNTVEELLKELNEDYTPGEGGGGGSVLPAPGTAGNVLTDNGTAWVSAAPADATELDFTLTIGEAITCDKTVADIVNALEANRPVMGVVDGVGTLVVKTWNAELNKVVLLLYIHDSNKLTVVEFNGTSGTPDTWAMDAPNEIKGLPAASASNNGQVLGVDNGAAAWVDAKPLIVSGVFIEGSGGDPNTVDITSSGLTLTEIYDAAQAGRTVYLEYTNTDSETGAVDTTRYNLGMRVKTPTQADPSVFEYNIAFVLPMSMTATNPAVAGVVFSNSLVGEFKLSAAQ